MMGDEQAKKIMKDTSDSIGEILEVARSVKGDRFANVVGAIVNLRMLTKGLAVITAAIKESSESEHIDVLVSNMLNVIGSVGDLMLNSIDDDGIRSEAFNMAVSIFKRSEDVERHINV